MQSVGDYLETKAVAMGDEELQKVVSGITQSYIAFLQMTCPGSLSSVTEEEIYCSLYTRRIVEKDGMPLLMLDIESDPIIQRLGGGLSPIGGLFS
jgi:hypothetical protein